MHFDIIMKEAFSCFAKCPSSLLSMIQNQNLKEVPKSFIRESLSFRVDLYICIFYVILFFILLFILVV